MSNKEDETHILDLKHRLLEKAVFLVISHSLYQPTEEKWEKLAEDYQRDQNIAAFGWVENGNIYGVMILKRLSGGSWEIQHIATHPEHRNRRIASG